MKRLVPRLPSISKVLRSFRDSRERGMDALAHEMFGGITPYKVMKEMKRIERETGRLSRFLR